VYINTAPSNIRAASSRNLISATRTVSGLALTTRLAPSVALLGVAKLGAKAIRGLAPRRTRRLGRRPRGPLALAICSCPPEQKRLEAALAFAARLRRLKPPKRP